MCYSLVLICPHLSYSHGQYHVFMQVSDQRSPPQRNYMKSLSRVNISHHLMDPYSTSLFLKAFVLRD